MTVFLHKESPKRIAGRARTSFLDSVKRTSFLAAIGSLSSSEQFVTGPELFIVIMNFIHKTLCFSRCHNVRCVRRMINWRNRNFYRISIKNFHSLNNQHWSNDCAFGNSCQDLGFSKIENVCIPGIEEWLFPIHRNHQVEVCTSSLLSHDIGNKFVFSHDGVSCILLASASKLRTFSRILFPGAVVEGGTMSCTSSGCNLVNSLLSTEKLARPFPMMVPSGTGDNAVVFG